MVGKSGAVLGALVFISRVCIITVEDRVKRLTPTQLTTSEAATIEKRAVVIPSQLPGTWVSQGCYT